MYIKSINLQASPLIPFNRLEIIIKINNNAVLDNIFCFSVRPKKKEKLISNDFAHFSAIFGQNSGKLNLLWLLDTRKDKEEHKSDHLK